MGLTKGCFIRYNGLRCWFGGVSEWFKELVLKTSESARARGFESYLLRMRPVGQAVKTSPFHGGNGSSILPRVIESSGAMRRFLRNSRKGSRESLPKGREDVDFFIFILKQSAEQKGR